MSTDKYTVERANADGFEVFILQDIKKQTTAKIIPELGNNCYSLTQIIEAKPIDIITPPPRSKDTSTTTIRLWESCIIPVSKPNTSGQFFV